MRIAMLAPPYAPVGTAPAGARERAIARLCDHLVGAGHDVVLYAACGSRSAAQVVELGGECLFALEVDHVARAFALIDGAAQRGAPFDLVHDHCPFAALAMADRLAVPMVHTIHGEVDEALGCFYVAHGSKARLVATSRAQLACAAVALNAAVVPEDRPQEHLAVYARALAMAPVGSRHGRHRRFRDPAALADPVC